jgi:bacterioferritin-associated ferredoxin
MIVCSCNVLSDSQVRDAVADPGAGVRTAGQVYRCLGCSPQCGRCARTIRGIIDQAMGAACGACPLECPVSHVHSHEHAHREHAHHEHAQPVALAAE